MKFFSLINILIYAATISLMVSCANIVPPGGGPKDTLPPKLLMATPKDSVTQFLGNKIQLVFDEFVDVKETQQQVIVSPYPKNQPQIDYKLHNVTIKLKDSLEPNTTYTIDFGNAIKDVNEGNTLKNFKYIFSTGKTIDNGSFGGRVLLAETGKTDSTLLIVLHQNLQDSAVLKLSPRYIAKIDGNGFFAFNNLPNGQFNVFVLPNDFSKKYDDSTKMFAFAPNTVTINQAKDSVVSIKLFAFEEFKRKEKEKLPIGNQLVNSKNDTLLKYTVTFDNGRQDLLQPLNIDFNKKIGWKDSSQLLLCDTLYKPVNGYQLQIDTSGKTIRLKYAWKEQQYFKLLIGKNSVKDSLGKVIVKADTLNITTKQESEYGSVKLRFLGINLKLHPVLQIIDNGVIKESVILQSNEWVKKLFKPGDYELRILYDANQNGVWDTGNYAKKKQPEKVYAIPQKLSVKANWDNENDYEINEF